METTVCPWCHTEIVWDEEFGPEDTCPHCNNELSGYRTITVGVDDLEDEELEEETPDVTDDDDISDENLWDDDDKESVVPIFNTLDQFGDDYDLKQYEQSVAAILAAQLEAPECPQCHELLVLSGTQQVTRFEPSSPEALGGPVLKAPFALNLYVCPSCFHVQQSLVQEDRVQFVRNLSTGNK